MGSVVGGTLRRINPSSAIMAPPYLLDDTVS